MCELFGMSCQRPDRAQYSLSSFRELSDENRDGWGLAYYHDGKAVVEKEPIGAKSSERFATLIQNISSTISRIDAMQREEKYARKTAIPSKEPRFTGTGSLRTMGLSILFPCTSILW